jgi:hypothetical protein
MILTFPDLDTVRLALTSGAVPAAVALARAGAAFAADGRVWVEPSAELPRKALADLRRLGAAVVKPAGALPRVELVCWLQLLPLEPAADSAAPPERAPILFELADGQQFAALVSEVLRLGNDRQAYRWLDDAQGKPPGRTLLRVIGPPYYSLLRALDREGQPSAPVAYQEEAPRVWVQLGYRHPLGEHIRPAPGQLLLLRPPRRWAVLPEAPFRDIYEVLEFALPGQATRWNEADLGRRLTVPLRLTHVGADDAADLWVVRNRPVEQLDDLVREADDALLARLAFAVGERDGQTVIVLKARPSKQPPPELPLDALAFRQHQQRLPNLFLPVGTRLSPPLRRDVVRRTLADDPAQITWLVPGGDGGFTPESLPDSAFRPLADWVDYVLDHDHQPLRAWVDATRFEFEAFVCEDDQRSDRPTQPPREPRARRERTHSAGAPHGDSAALAGDGNGDAGEQAAAGAEESPESATVPAAPADELREQLEALEQRFLGVDGALDAPERRQLWPEMADLNARIGNADDASLCWTNALWQGDEGRVGRALAWFRAEAQAVPLRSETGWPHGRTWASAAALAPRGAQVAGAILDLLLKLPEPSPADVRGLAAHIFWAACQKTPPESLAQRLSPIGQFLEAHEAVLPVRAAWLAALGLQRLAGGDALGLARARDRLLGRLYQDGLRPERDLPSFLRFSGPAGNQRYRAVRQWLAALCDKARDWAGRNTPSYRSPEKTAAYIDLFFSFGLARLGELDASNGLLKRATDALHGQGHAHEFLLNAYAHRIRQAQQGKPHAGPLPTEYMEELFDIYAQEAEHPSRDGRPDRYIIDRLREKSRILEPSQDLEPYRFFARPKDQFRETLQRLPDVLDPAEVVTLVRQLLHKVPAGEKGLLDRADGLSSGLNQAPRVGEEFARELLQQVPESFDALPPPVQPDEFRRQVTLLDKALSVAAHFDCNEFVQQLVVRFERLLQALREARTEQALDRFDDVAGQCFRGLRRLGLQDDIRRLLRVLAEALLRGRDLRAVEDPEWRGQHPAALRALLHVAGSWYYFGEERQADAVLGAAAAELLTSPQKENDNVSEYSAQGVVRRIDLARAYAAALSHAPVDRAQAGFEDLLDKLQGIRDTWTTDSHYQLSHLLVVEAIVLAVASDEFTLGPRVRHWLDDDEYLVRRRIHEDVRALVAP